ncbi:Hypothetical_protein [Hexamita inflata]|uniref:Hypothetical_protein n=1 Tax=Hexamita inflata TaxID=28002 RepID=A0AA86U539_9EUKA|nr:Hypothetical protein HINF_LOCUS30690 [Hexamita inflata]
MSSIQESSESSANELQQFINQPGDEFCNLDVGQIRQYLQKMHTKPEQKQTAEEEQPAEPLKFIPVKNHIESDWAPEKDAQFLQMVKNENDTDWEKVSQTFQLDLKTVKYHFQVLQQIWTIDQQSKLLALVQQSLQNNEIPNFKQIAVELNKTKTQCQKHYQKLMAGCWTDELDQIVLKVAENNFDREDLTQEDFAETEKQIYVLKQQIHERFVNLRDKSNKAEKFWFKKEASIALAWYKSNKDSAVKNFDELRAVCKGYDLFDIRRLIRKQ